jgi:AraC-like DNA-binding protein
VRQLNRQRRELLEKYMELIAAKRNREETTETDQLGETVLTSLPDDDHKFMEHVMQYIEENLSNSDANIHDMASAAATSNSNLNRKLRSLIGITAAQLLIDARMRKAHDLLTDKSVRKINIADVAYRCGYADPKYFSRCYKQKHGITPSEEIARRSNTDFS